MTTEEKAKAYDEALERAKQKHGKFSEFVTKTIEEIFPELRESEDERIRTLLVALVQWAKTFNQSGLDPDTVNKMLSYLEKQKEQKPAERDSEEVFDKIDKSFRKGREVGFQEGVESVKPAEWNEKDKIIIEGACNALKIYGHTKLASMLKSLRPQPKQELSKKDKKILQSLHSVMNCADAQNAVKRNGLSVADVCNFLFSIEPYWKPSEEQMKALQSARFLYRDGLENSATASALESLYLDLKKL